MLEKKNLPSFYKQEVKPKINQFEAKRLIVRNNLLICIALFISIFFCLFLFANVKKVPEALSLIGLAVSGIGLFIQGKKTYQLFKDYKEAFKKEVVEKIIALILPGCTYSHTKRISSELYFESNLFTHRVDRWSGDDYVEGVLDKTHFQFSELHTQYKTRTTDSKGRSKTQWHTIFMGVFFVADFNKNIKSETYVFPDIAENLFGGWIGKKLQSFNSNFQDRGELVRLESPEFEKKFVVYSKDQQEARYILTPKIMEQILRVQKKTNKKFQISFKGNKVYIAINFLKNHFEPSIFNNSLKYSDVKEMYQLLDSVFNLVHEFDLNLRIWTKD